MGTQHRWPWTIDLARAINLVIGEAKRDGATFEHAFEALAAKRRSAETREETRFERSQPVRQRSFPF